MAGDALDQPAPSSIQEWIEQPARMVFYGLLPLATGTSRPRPLVDVIPDIAPRRVMLVATGTGFELRQERKLAAVSDHILLHEIPEAVHGGGYAARPQEYGAEFVSFFAPLAEGGGSVAYP